MYLRVKTRCRDSHRRGLVVNAVTMAGCQARLDATPRLHEQAHRPAPRDWLPGCGISGMDKIFTVWRKKMQSQGAVRASKPTMICPRLLQTHTAWWWRGSGHATTSSLAAPPLSCCLDLANAERELGCPTKRAAGRFVRQTWPLHIPRGSGGAVSCILEGVLAREGCDPTKLAAVGSGMRCCCAPASGRTEPPPWHLLQGIWSLNRDKLFLEYLGI